MNTRLQVEHPITELVTGIDIVEQMIRIAYGEKLRLSQGDIKYTGSAIECRAYAEDPSRDFVPSIGRLIKYNEPKELKNIRLDSGVYEGSDISRFYDPMIAKVISYGETREKAINLMADALDCFVIRGIKHNLNFMRNILAVNSFVDGNYSTDFISDNWPRGYNNINYDESLFVTAIAIGAFIDCKFRYRGSGNLVKEMICFVGPEKKKINCDYKVDICNIKIDKKNYEVSSKWIPGQILFDGSINGKNIYAQVDLLDEGHIITLKGNQFELIYRSKAAGELSDFMPVKEEPDLSKFLISPMPGLLLRIDVREGDSVSEGDSLAVIDAMKMENVLIAEKKSIVKKIFKKENQSLMMDDIIIEFE